MQALAQPTQYNDHGNLNFNKFLLTFGSHKTEERYQYYATSALNRQSLEFSFESYIIFEQIISLVYLANYIVTDSDVENIDSLAFQLTLIISSIFCNAMSLIFQGNCRISTRWFLLVSYFMICMILILNDSPLQAIIFSRKNNAKLSCLPGLLCLIISFPRTANYKILLALNSMIGVFYTLLILNQSDSDTNIFECTILLISLLYQVLKNYIEEYNMRIIFSKVGIEASEENERIMHRPGDLCRYDSRLQDCIESLRKILPSLKKSIKDTVENIITSLISISNSSRVSDNNSILEQLGSELDEEDKEYLQQGFLPTHLKKLNEQRKMTVRHSVDKIIESILNQDAIFILKQVSNSWNIDMFEFTTKTSNNPIIVLGKHCLKLYKLIEAFEIPEIRIGPFFGELQASYKNNPYHNATHAVDVLASGLFFISHSALQDSFSELDMLIVIISHLAHDVGHPGLSNRFLIAAHDPIALRCNL